MLQCFRFTTWNRKIFTLTFVICFDITVSNNVCVGKPPLSAQSGSLQPAPNGKRRPPPKKRQWSNTHPVTVFSSHLLYWQADYTGNEIVRSAKSLFTSGLRDRLRGAEWMQEKKTEWASTPWAVGGQSKIICLLIIRTKVSYPNQFFVRGLSHALRHR